VTAIIDFKWTGPRLCELTNGVIRQIRDGRETREPLKYAPDLYLRFAELSSEDACLAFARAHGLLTTPAKIDAKEPLEVWWREIKMMKSLAKNI
jgi:hypothetical protein